MTLVSGPLSTVTDTPSAVSRVNISINSPRTRGSGVMTPEVKAVAVTGSNFSSQIAPGPAVLSLLIGGRESAPIPILVDDVTSQTLAEVVDAARLATGYSAESLAQLVQQVLDGVAATEADATQTGLDRTATGEDRVQTGLDRQAAAQSATNAATSAGEAATHEDTSLDAAAAAIAAAVSVAQFQGHGFPNGKVAAPVGSIYTDLDATAGAIRWIKTTGTGNTGWQVEPSSDTVTALATWTADAAGGRNYFSYTHLSNLENWHPGTYSVLKEVIQLEPNSGYTFYAEEITADTEEEWTVLNLMDGTDGVLPYSISNPNRLLTIYNRKYEDEPQYGRKVTFTTPSSGKVYFEFYAHGKRGEEAKPFWVTEKLVRAQIVRGGEVPEWRPSPEDAVRGYLPNGESMSPLLPFDPATTIRVDNSVGTRVLVGDTMIHGDTGWRDVGGMLINGWEGNLFVRRDGNIVSYRGRLSAASATNANAWDIPNGFRIGILRSGAGYDYGTAQVWTDENLPTIRRMSFYFDRFSINGYQPGEVYVVGLSYTSMSSWPTTLPGTPA